MSGEEAILAAAATVIAGLLYLILRRGRHIKDLQGRLESAAADLQHLQQSCARFAPASVIDRVVTEGLESGAEWKEITALFADIAGSTALGERMDARSLAKVLNGYYQNMSDAIDKHRGHVSTFLGDGILAYFGAFDPNPWQSDDAVRAALAMRNALVSYNQTLKAEGLQPLVIGIGLHRGWVLAGLVGSRERMEYSCVGRTVNLAARVQSLTRIHEVDILLTEAVRDNLDPAFSLRALPATAVKGIEEPVITYTVS